MVKRSNSTVTKWAPLVYGRTYEVDFRFLAVPADFGEDQDQAREYIQASFSSFTYDRLRGCPRWIMFRDEQRCVVGATCMVEEIPGVPADQYQDREGRPLYVFLGFVSQSPFPQIPSRELRWFSKIYDECAKPRFWEKHYSREKDRLPAFPYETRKWQPPSEPKKHLSGRLNTDGRKVGFWSEEDSEKVWYSAAHSTEAVSVCLGLSRKSDALTGPLLNATLHGLSAPCIEDKEVKSSEDVPPLPDQPISSPSPRNPRENGDRISFTALPLLIINFLKSLCPCNRSDSQKDLAGEQKEKSTGSRETRRNPSRVPPGFRPKKLKVNDQKKSRIRPY